MDLPPFAQMLTIHPQHTQINDTQEDMAEVGGLALLYDPVQTAMGQLTVRAFRRLRTPASKCVGLRVLRVVCLFMCACNRREGRYRAPATIPTDHYQPTNPTTRPIQRREEAEAVGSFKDLLEEIPVTLRNPGIVSALLFDMQVRARQSL